MEHIASSLQMCVGAMDNFSESMDRALRALAAVRDFGAPKYIFVGERMTRRLMHVVAMAKAKECKRASRQLTHPQKVEMAVRKRYRRGGVNR